jgi:hypothetical protein
MSVQDVIKKSVLELNNFTNTFTIAYTLHIILVLCISLLFGLIINVIYIKFFKGVVYSRSFSITLVGITVLTTAVTLAISSNIVISLGMVGALSIVRFRTAVKDPLDLLYLFWSITTGIILGASLFSVATVSLIIVFFVLLIMTRKTIKGRSYIAILHYTGHDTEDKIRIAMGRMRYRFKSKSARSELYELAMEIFIKGDSMAFAERLKTIEGVQDVTVVQYDGEYNG